MRYSFLALGLCASVFAQERVNPVIPSDVDKGQNITTNINDPSSKNAQAVCPGYRASNVKQSNSGVEATLDLAGDACNVYGTDVKSLKLQVTYQSNDRLNVKIVPTDLSDPKEKAWYIIDPNIVAEPSSSNPVGPSDSDFVFSMEENPFSFTVTRKSTNDVVFTTKGSKIVFENQFVEWKTTVPSGANIYGLGDAITPNFRLGENNRTIYSADIGDVENQNLYGTHPFYLEQRYAGGKGYSHGVYSRNFYGQDVLLEDGSVTYRTIGGSIDLYFFSGPTPAKVSQSYITEIGKPAMQQYWTLGYHQCRWGYHNVSESRMVVETFKKFNIPLETFWLDIDYMDQYRDFTVDPHTFPLEEFRPFLDDLHKQDQHFVPIFDAAFYIPNPNNASDAYDTYTRGHEMDVWMKNPDGSEYIGAVWPGYTVFPDFTAKKAQEWWDLEFAEWYKEVPYDGMWLDMNEVSSFCVGSCGSEKYQDNPAHVPFKLPGEKGAVDFNYPEGFNRTNATEAAAAASASASQEAEKSASATPTPDGTSFVIPPVETGIRNINYPPYAINNSAGNHDLAVHRMGPNATHANGQADYEIASLFGIMETKATYSSLQKIYGKKRPFILSRSTAPGSGKYAAHWGGDNKSTFYYMKQSIQQALNFGLFGIPWFGVDTCGFAGNSDLELCSRWMQLSAFFTFYRNHNVLSTAPQEPYIWADVAEASRVAMKIRYSLLPYMYTLTYHAYQSAATFIRALSWEFPDDESLATIDKQFMVGSALMVVPVLEPGATDVTGVFPGGQNTRWYDWYTAKAMPSGNVTVPAPLGHIPVFVKGGSVLPMQKPGYTTKESREGDFDLLVALDSNGSACGDLYVDDGETTDAPDYNIVTFHAEKSCLKINTKSTGSLSYDKPLDTITVYGVNGAPRNVKAGNNNCEHQYDSNTGKLTIKAGLKGWKDASNGWEVCWN